MNKGRKNKTQKITASVLAIILTIAMAVGLVPSEVMAAKEADLNTTASFTDSLGDNTSTEYAGRIWTDKSVFSEDATFTSFGGNQQTVANDDDFLVSFSALATSQSVSGKQQAPVDVVFIIDLSSSMTSNTMDNGRTRLYNMVQALNASVKELVALNENVRIGVMGYNNTSRPILPLDTYKQNGSREFFTVSGNTITYNAIGTKNTYNNAMISTGRGTNIQKGVYEGMRMLAEETSKSVTVNGTEIQRVPSVILLTDGEPSIASTYDTWWNLSADNSTPSNTEPRAIYGMKALMTASYMKAAIDRNYGGGANAVKVYSIGMGITDVSSSYRPFAYATINPNDSTLKNGTNGWVEDMRDTWTAYANGGTPTLGGYKFNHPAQHDIVPADKNINALYYVDAYYDADDAASVTDVFSSIVNTISISRPEVPTEHDETKPLDSGFITYTDPIGEYMEVKDMKAIIYAGQQFTVKSKTTSGTETEYTDTYVFEGSVENPVYGAHSLDEIEISVETTVTSGIKDQTVTIKIPAGAIPIRVNVIELNQDGTVKSHTNNGAYPVRVLYTVGIQEEIEEAGYVNAQKISAEYLAKNTNADGTINFYSNLYTGTNEVNGYTAGDAVVEFEPSHTNPFYYIQEDTVLYTSEAMTEGTKASADTELVDDQLYYYPDEHYHGNVYHSVPIERTGAQLKNAGVVNIGGYWHRPVGSPRLNRILEFEGTKILNATGTAEDFYAPTFVQTGATPYDGKFVIYLGNNGLLTANAGGNLEFKKTVSADDGITAPDESFTFHVDFTNADGVYNYTIVDTAENVISNGTISDGGTITLKAGQIARIVNLPPNAGYSISEDPVEGFTTTVDGSATGTITANATTAVGFINHYSVDPITYSALQGYKVLSGRDLKSTDIFAFEISSPDGAPLPANTRVVLSGQTAADGEKAAFDFGDITFEAPGTYNYRIVELTPGMASENRLVGVSYSKEIYELQVVVADQGDGTLKITAADLSRVQNEVGDEITAETVGEIVFTNTYQVDTLHFGPVAIKTYTDKSGQKPLADGMFTFQMKPSSFNTETDVPMPTADDVYVAHNFGEYVSFGQIEFTNAHVGKTYYYELSEVNGGVNGMTYDTSKTIVQILVTSEDVGGVEVIKVTPTYMDESMNPLTDGSGNPINNAAFTNVYEPEAVIVAFEGTKTMVGRDMLSGEEFEFGWGITDNDGFTSYEFRTNMGLANFTLEPTAANGADGEEVDLQLGSLEIRKPGTYYFYLKELVPATKAGGVTYDEVIRYITIEVVDNDGVLEATVTYDNGGVSEETAKAEFINTYDAEAADPISISGEKTVTGRALEEGKFFFEVIPLNGAPMGERTIIVTPEADGSVHFLSNVSYEEAGTYEYIVREQIPENADANHKLDGYTYDDTIYKITIVVTDDGTGKLTTGTPKFEEVTETIQDGTPVYTVVRTVDELVFNNVYETTPEGITPLAMRKVLLGNRNEGLKAGEFTFRKTIVSGPENGATFGTYPAIVTETTITNDASGIVQFGDITFIKPGTYVIQIAEVVPAPADMVPGVTYDTHVIQSTFEVTDDGAGNLIVVRTNTTGSREFRNIYESEGSIDLSVKKDFTGRTGNEWLATDVFTFVLEANDEATRNAIAAGKVELPANAATGITIDKNTTDYTEAFEDLVIREAGEYVFRIRELDGGIPGINYDATAEIVHVTAVDNGNGTLTVSVPAAEQVVTFENIYETDSTVLAGHGNLHVTKVLEGRDWLDSQFQFVIAPYSDNAKLPENVVMPSETTLTVNKDNKDVAHFGNITFKEVGTYVFEVKEVVPADPAGITYDTTPRYVTAVVTDTGAGTLAVSVSNLTDADYLTFTNTYEAAPVSVADSVTVTKNLTGRNWTAEDEFTFVILSADVETSIALGEGSVELLDAQAAVTSTVTDGKVSFGDITFKKPGIYTFEIEEKIPADADKAENVSYDNRTVTVTFTVEDNLHGELVVADKEFSSTSLVWTNIYTPTPASVTLEAAKEISGREWKTSDVFTFMINGSDGAPMPENVFAETDALHKAVFGSISFNAAGVYTYYINEIGTYEGLTNDSRTLVATVTVENNMEGSYVASVAYAMTGSDPAATTFVNTYNSTGELDGALNLKVTKNLTGRPNDEWLATDSFTFRLAADESHQATKDALAAGQIVLPAEDELVVTAENRADAHFGNIRFTKAGTFRFLISELAGTIPGVSYDTNPKTVIVDVVDNWDGTLTATVADESSTLTFNNVYRASGTLAGVEVTKNFTGRDGNEWLATDSFTFVLEAADAVTEYELGKSIEIQGADEIVIKATTPGKKAAFGDIVFEKTGTYKFIVREVKPVTDPIPGVEYDGQPRLVTVEVTDNNDATLSAEAVITLNGNVTSLVFNNRYTEEEVRFSGHNNLHVNKVLTGRSWTEEDQFEFTIEPYSANAKNASIVTMEAPTTITVDANNRGYVHFGNIIFREDGEYQFLVKETVPAETFGISYDTTVRIVTVAVTTEHVVQDGNHLAVLKAAVKSVENASISGGSVSVTGTAADKQIVFTNEYDADDVTLDGSVNLEVTKHLEGRDWDINGNADAFGFKIEAHSDNAKDTSLVEMKAPTTIDITSGTKKNAFGDILFKAEGTYVFKISEVPVAGDNIEMGTDPVLVTVEVADNGKGNLEATPSYSAPLEFTNIYAPDPISVSLNASKVVKEEDGTNIPMTEYAAAFTFVVSKPDNAGAAVPEVNAAAGIQKNDEHGNVEFVDVVTFTEPGTYVYNINEVSGDLSGIRYDDTTIKATIKVTYDPATGKLSAAAPEYSVANAQFTNIYSVVPTEPFSLSAEKEVVEYGGNTYVMQEGDFEFQLIVDENNPSSDPAKAVVNPIENKADGSIPVLTNVKFTEAGTYKYILDEIDRHIAGFNYDHAIYEIIVEVVDKDAELVVESYDIIKYVHGATDSSYNKADGIQFTNTYHAPTDVETIEGTKNLTGKPIVDGEFQFKIEAVGCYDGTELKTDAASKAKVPMPADVIAENIGHIFRFDDIVYSKTDLGKYEYKISEVNLGAKGISYDSSSFRVIVEVTEDSLQNIISTISYPDGDIVFDNSYKPHAVAEVIDGTKTLLGRNMKAGEFQFELTPVSYRDAAGNLSTSLSDIPMPANAIVSNLNAGAESDFEFGEITFTKTGRYRYVLEEVQDVIGGVTFDQTSYGVVVEVTDDGFTGQLKATVIFYEDAKTVKNAEFINRYEADPATAALEGGIKTLYGRPLKEGEFKFRITAVSGPNGVTVPMPANTTVANDVIGNISFGVVEYAEPGTYVYKISEVNNHITNIAYDTTEFEVTVTVVDDGDGQMDAFVSGMTDVNFENTYTPDSVAVKLEGLKLFNRTLKADEFTFIILRDGPSGTHSEVKNDASGKIVFIDENFTSTGKYTYYLMEAIPANASYDAEADVYSLDGVVYDAVAYKYTFTVKDDENGKLYVDDALTRLDIVDRDTREVISASAVTTGVKFENEYFVPKLVVSKKQALGSEEPGTDKLQVKAGDVVTYHITVENTANYSVADDIVIEDAIPEGLIVDLTSISDGGKVNEEEGIITWEIAELNGGEIKTVSFQVSVPDVKVDTDWENIATVIDNDTPQDSNKVVIEEGAPVLDIVKEQKVNEGEFTKETLEAQIGDTVTYRITIKNSGTETAENITLSDVIPAGLTLAEGSISDGGEELNGIVSWVIGDLGVNETAAVSFQVNVPKIDRDASWTNVAAVVYDNDPTPDEPEESNEVTVETEYVEPRLAVLKQQAINDGTPTSDKQSVVEGDVVTYFIKVSNTTENADAKDVVIKDAIPEGLKLIEDSISEGGVVIDDIITWRLGTVEGGTDIVVSFQVEVPDVSVDTVWDNIAVVTQTVPTEDPDDPDEKPEESNKVEIEEGTPDLALVKLQKVNMGELTDQVLEAEPGDTVTYSIELKNKGTEAADNITVTDEIPAGLELVEDSISDNGQELDGAIVWTVETLASGESVTLSFQVTVPKVSKDTSWTNVATAVCGNNPEDPEEPEESNEVTVETEYVVPQLVLVKKQAVNDGKVTEEITDVEENDIVTYFITVTNKTEVSDAKAVVIKDRIPEGLELLEDSISDGGEVSDGIITWNLGAVPGGESVTVSFQVRVPDVTEDTAWENVAIVTQTVPAEEPEEEPEESNKVIAESGVPKLVVSKLQRVNLGTSTTEKQSVRVGDVILYSIIVSNEGTEVARNIIIEDKIPEGLVLKNNAITDGGVEENGVIRWEIDSLEAGTSVVVSFAVKVPAVLEDTEYQNIATVLYKDQTQESNEVVVENQVAAPKMGDETNITLWLAAAAVSLTTCITVYSKKRKEA